MYIYVYVYVYVYVSIYLPICLSIFLSIYIYVYIFNIKKCISFCVYINIHMRNITCNVCLCQYDSMYVPARGGAEVALGIYYKAFLIYRTCMRRAPARPVRACFVRSCCSVAVQEHDLRVTPVQCNAKRRLSSHVTRHSSYPALHTSLALHLNSSHLSSSHLISCLLICQLSSSWLFSFHSSAFVISPKLVSTHLGSSAHQSTTLYYKACAEYFPVLRCTTKLAQSTFQSYFVLQTLHKALPSTTLYYKACTQYRFVLQSLRKARSSTTL